ncbi:MAG: 5-methyltetrahydropteroyltriglutamate--homocysteine S-methyltransferase [Bilifractor sp.]
MKTTIIGYPRIGASRELKRAEEAYFKKSLSQQELQRTAAKLRVQNLKTFIRHKLDIIPVGDFSYYDGVLDTACMLGIIPQRYQSLGLDRLDTYFAMAHGYQHASGDVTALAMKKWFNTNYHYIVPEYEDGTRISLDASRLQAETEEALQTGIDSRNLKISVTGPLTFLRLTHFTGHETADDIWQAVAKAYTDLLSELPGECWVSFDEPWLVRDLSEADLRLFRNLYTVLLGTKGQHRILLQTFFGDIRDCYQEVTALPFDGIGLDFVEGRQTVSLIRKYGFPSDKSLFAGIINGKNIWRCHYESVLDLLPETGDTVLSTSCSLLHVPYTTANESSLSGNILKHLAFAEQKLDELQEVSEIAEARLSDREIPESAAAALERNRSLFDGRRVTSDPQIQKKLSSLTPDSFVRKPDFAEREKIQHAALKLPLLPTTTIGSFPQTREVRSNRLKFRRGEITQQQYDTFNKEQIRSCVELQENLGLDVLVHGEFERNDMAEYFGDHLEGFLFTENGWVQSYGTRCVKPPIIWSDIRRREPITVETSVYAQSLTEKPMKGMLTGPVTILNWSFPREDISRKEMAMQIALAIRAEVLDLEKNGIRIIQIDEAALREKLPLRKSDWHSAYLDWAIPAFRLVHSGVKPETQIHTHMCYSEFGDIIHDIDNMDADVITFEASRSSLEILGDLQKADFRTEVGPGVYDIHSSRIPSEQEISSAIRKMLHYIPKEKLWINPDCGLKTRGVEETIPSLSNMVAAAAAVRKEL